MNITFTSSAITEDVDLVAVCIHDADKLPATVTELDTQIGGGIARELASGDLVKPSTAGSVLLSGQTSGPLRVLVVTANSTKLDVREATRQAGAVIADHARKLKASTISLIADGDDHIESLVEGVVLGHYRFDRYKSQPEEADGEDGESVSRVPNTNEVNLQLLGATDKQKSTVAMTLSVANATNWGRDLANSPSNLLTPTVLAKAAEDLAAQHAHMSVKIMGRQELLDREMGLFSAVAQGGTEDPKCIILEWNPPADARDDNSRIAMVGKAVTFDTGGISIKPSAGMENMKLDKSGGCAVIGAMRAIAETDCQNRVLAIVGATENMPSGNAYKPGDVITAKDGTTVEVTNTDAEGRLVLADCISLAREMGCGGIVELSTLTGAMVLSLGHHFTGAVARKSEVLDRVHESAEATGDLVWHLPMDDAYKPGLKSDCADMVNSGARMGGGLMAGLFVEHFAKDTPFVHLDVAGTAMLPKPQGALRSKGASGWGVRLLTHMAHQHS